MMGSVFRRLGGPSLLGALVVSALVPLRVGAEGTAGSAPARATQPAAVTSANDALAARDAHKRSAAWIPAKDAVALPQSQVFDMTSKAGKAYRILVSVPAGEPPAEGYGVLVVLDANAYFGVAADAMGLLRQFPLMPEKGKLTEAAPTLVVGVAYPGDEPINGERRTWDFVPPAQNPASLERLRGPAPGGADAFTAFLVDALRPAIASAFPINPHRQTLAGHSLGGYYVLHALATQPDAFQRYVSISPAVWWDDSRILKDLASLKPGKAQVMLAMAKEEWPGWPDGSAEMLNGARSVRDVLARAGLEGDALRYVELADQDHMTTAFATMPAVTRWSSLP